MRESEQSEAAAAAKYQALDELELKRAMRMSMESAGGTEKEKRTAREMEGENRKAVVMVDETSPLDGEKPHAAPVTLVKRSKGDRQNEMVERVTNALSDMQDNATPSTVECIDELFEDLADEGNNGTLQLTRSKATKETPAEGTSPEVAGKLVGMKKRANKKKQGD